MSPEERDVTSDMSLQKQNVTAICHCETCEQNITCNKCSIILCLNKILLC